MVLWTVAERAPGKQMGKQVSVAVRKNIWSCMLRFTHVSWLCMAGTMKFMAFYKCLLEPVRRSSKMQPLFIHAPSVPLCKRFTHLQGSPTCKAPQESPHLQPSCGNAKSYQAPEEKRCNLRKVKYTLAKEKVRTTGHLPILCHTSFLAAFPCKHEGANYLLLACRNRVFHFFKPFRDP